MTMTTQTAQKLQDDNVANQMELNLGFGGFYYSVHSDIVDSWVESNFDEDGTLTEEEYYDSIDYQKVHKDYCKHYVSYLFDYILDTKGVKLTTKQSNIDMWSPREYNFSTDVIVLKEVSSSTVKNLTTLFNMYLEDKEFRDSIKDKTTSRSGYIPFYKYEDVVDKKELQVSLEFLLEFIADEFNDEVEELYKITESL